MGGGQVYTQREFYRHDSLLTNALGQKAPENIVLVPWDNWPRYWIIEAKAAHRDLTKAMSEARRYADRINAENAGTARFATGIAGTPDESFYVRTAYWNGAEWQEVSINNYETTGFLSPDQCQHLLEANDNHLALFEPDQDRFFKKTREINKTLHDNEVPVGDRAGFMAALLLALAQDGNLRIHAEPSRLIREINGLIEDILREKGKEDFAKVIGLQPPATEKNHDKFRTAIVETLQHLREMNIRSAINSGTDALGQFYETFLKYANGAKEMGVVLTPRHITRFAVDVVGIGPNDRIFDPTCGTGGFLISAMELIRQKNPPLYEAFRCKGLFGVEQRDDVYGLAVVNMIFRGDGQSRIYDGDCLKHEFWLRDGDIFYTLPNDAHPDGASRPFTRILMNPPFKQKTTETAFVDYALRQTKPGGILFAVLPAVVIAGGRYESWRKELLKRHTVRVCIKLGKNLFQPGKWAT
ncbi:MAG: N-6 DNA methylase [Roseovarius sp.]|nr:N-6 DNA methylase [Roseovarius sp.]